MKWIDVKIDSKYQQLRPTLALGLANLGLASNNHEADKARQDI